jgi:hypothetical protein
MPERLEARAAGAAARARMRSAAAATALLLLAACASAPTGPGVMVLPGSGKSFDQFRIDDNECRQYASAQVGGATANEAGTSSGLKTTAVGTGIGAAAGGLISGRSGVGVGAGFGLLAGALVGSSTADQSSRALQNRYDIAYQQCMYAKGHQIPMARGSYVPRAPRYSSAPPPPPPPPPGSPPPPPAGYRVN